MAHSKSPLTPTSVLIDAKDLSVELSGKTIVDRVSLSIEQGEVVTVIGPNGAGKSSLIKALLGILPSKSGIIHKKPDLILGYMPQKTHFNPNLPINTEYFLSLAGNFSKKQINDSLSLVNANSLHKKTLNGLSGGEFQRVLLARAILRRPELLVLDEPGQGVDIKGQQELYQLLGQIKHELGSAILMVSHDLHLVMSSTDRVICLNQHICCSGHPESVSSDPAYLQLFGIQNGKGLAIYEHHHDHDHDMSGQVVDSCEGHHHD